MSERNLGSKFNKKPAAVLAGILAVTALSACGEKVSEPTETKTITATAEPTPSPEASTEQAEVSNDLSPEAIEGKPPVENTANSLEFPYTYSANLRLYKGTPTLARDNYDEWRKIVTAPIKLTPEEMANENKQALSISDNILAQTLAVMNAGRTAEDTKDCDGINSGNAIASFEAISCGDAMRQEYEVDSIYKELKLIPEETILPDSLEATINEDGLGGYNQYPDIINFYNAVTGKQARRAAYEVNDCNDGQENDEVDCRVIGSSYVNDTLQYPIGEENPNVSDIKYTTDPAGGFEIEFEGGFSDLPSNNTDVSQLMTNSSSFWAIFKAKGTLNKTTGEVEIASIETDVMNLENVTELPL